MIFFWFDPNFRIFVDSWLTIDLCNIAFGSILHINFDKVYFDCSYQSSLLAVFGLVHGLRTPNGAFFHWNPDLLASGQVNSWAFLAFLAKLSASILQGISHWTGLYELALTDRNMQVKSCLKVVLEFWDDKFLICVLGFLKSNIGWPQQLLTERV